MCLLEQHAAQSGGKRKKGRRRMWISGIRKVLAVDAMDDKRHIIVTMSPSDRDHHMLYEYGICVSLDYFVLVVQQ